MNFLRRLILHDLGRKLLALAVAVFVWWRVATSIVKEEYYSYRIVTDATQVALSLPHIKVVEPDGWMLVEPKPGSDQKLTFKATPTDMNEFYSTSRATVDIKLEVRPGRLEFSRDLRPLDFVWNRKARAELVLKNADNGPITFTFQKRDDQEYLLAPESIKIIGSPVDGYAIKTELIQFHPSTITIHGAKDMREDVDSLGTKNELFESFVLPSQIDRTVSSEIRMHKNALAAGLRMQPASFLVTVPIRAAASEPVSWVPDEPELVGSALNDIAWTIRTWKNVTWVASYEPIEGLDLALTPTWLKKHIQFQVYLDQIPENATTGQVLLADWALVHRDDIGDYAMGEKLKNALRIQPLELDAEEARTVSLDKPK
jgi:hypothetical protein